MRKTNIELIEFCVCIMSTFLYPIGMLGQIKYIYFSSALIDKVIHGGYSDSVEEAFVYQMKEQLIVKERRKSMGFANDEELKVLEELMKGVEK